MEEGIFCKIDPCVAVSFYSDLSLTAYQLGNDWIMLTTWRAYSPTLKLKYLIQYLRSLELLSKTEYKRIAPRDDQSHTKMWPVN